MGSLGQRPGSKPGVEPLPCLNVDSSQADTEHVLGQPRSIEHKASMDLRWSALGMDVLGQGWRESSRSGISGTVLEGSGISMLRGLRRVNALSSLEQTGLWWQREEQVPCSLGPAHA